MDPTQIFKCISNDEVEAVVPLYPPAYSVPMFKVNPFGTVVKQRDSSAIFQCWGSSPPHLRRHYFQLNGSDRPMELLEHPMPDHIQIIKITLEVKLNLVFSTCIFRVGSSNEILIPKGPCVILSLTPGYRLDFDGHNEAFSIRLDAGHAIMIPSIYQYTVRAPPNAPLGITLTFI